MINISLYFTIHHLGGGGELQGETGEVNIGYLEGVFEGAKPATEVGQGFRVVERRR